MIRKTAQRYLKNTFKVLAWIFLCSFSFGVTAQTPESAYESILGIWYPLDSHLHEPIFIEVDSETLTIKGVEIPSADYETQFGVITKKGIFNPSLPPFELSIQINGENQIKVTLKALPQATIRANFTAEFVRTSEIRQNLFISASTREFLGIETIFDCTVENEGNTGGMNENADLLIYSFGKDGAQADWNVLNDFPVKASEDYVLNDFTDSAFYINGNFYDYPDGKMQTYGGSGYGSFYVYEYEWLNDQQAMIIRRNTGHASANTDVGIQFLLLSRDLKPDTAINFNGSFDEELLDFKSLNSLYKSIKLIDNEITTDTTYFQKQQRTSTRFGYSINKIDSFELYYNPSDLPYFKQLYIGEEKAEDFVLHHFGFLPKVISIELYPIALWTLHYSEKVRQYFISPEPILFE